VFFALRTGRVKAACLGLLVAFALGVLSPAALFASEEGNGARRAFSSPRANRDLQIAEKMIRAGNYSQAIPRLLKVLSDYPDSTAAGDGRYWLGVAYEAIEDLRAASLQLNRYVADFPNGEFAADAQRRLARLEQNLDDKYVSEAEIEERLSQARAKIAAAPDEVGHRLELANLLWSKGAYSDAGAVYAEALVRWPRLADDTVVRQRMVRSASGGWEPLTPEMVVRAAAEKEPLLIYNTSSFRSGREEGLARSYQKSNYNVTGEVMNRSAQPLRDVQLYVTIYGFGAKVLDTKTMNIGRLSPGDSRAFSASFSTFDDIENVDRYEVKGSFER